MKRTMIFVLILTAFFFVNKSWAKEPNKVVREFFTMVEENKISEAYDGLCEGSSLQMLVPEAVDAVKRKTISNLLIYGEILGYEKIIEEKYGSSIIRLVYVLKSEKAPTIWEFYFYKAKSKWFLGNVQFNGQYKFLNRTE